MASTKKSMNLAVSLLMAADLLQAPLSATFSVLPIILVLDMYAQSDVGCRRALRECEEENVGLRREIQECELGVRKLLVQMGSTKEIAIETLQALESTTNRLLETRRALKQNNQLLTDKHKQTLVAQEQAEKAQQQAQDAQQQAQDALQQSQADRKMVEHYRTLIDDMQEKAAEETQQATSAELKRLRQQTLVAQQQVQDAIKQGEADRKMVEHYRALIDEMQKKAAEEVQQATSARPKRRRLQ